MSQPSPRSKQWIWLGALLVALIAIGSGVFRARVEAPPVAAQPPVPPSPRREAPPTASETPPAAPTHAAREVSESDPLSGLDFLDRDQELAFRWAQVDLAEVRVAMPENLFWERGAPTNDPAVRREREEQRARENEAWGQVLSGNASVEDIQAYYAHRQRISSDYIEFASHLLTDYGDVLPPRDVGLLELSVQMHHARLQEMPRQLTKAIERREKQRRLREAWRADEAAFEQALLDGLSIEEEPPESP